MIVNLVINMNKQEKILEIAEKVKLLFAFCADLIQDKEILKDTYDLASDKQHRVLSMAPIFGAFGENYEEADNEARIKKERAKALYALIDTLDRTEKERSAYADKKKVKQEGLAQLYRALGL